MKALNTYIAELNTPYAFRVKIAGIRPEGEVLTKIKNALDAYDCESISSPKSIPIQEHREFPKLGPCECYVMEVVVKYPTTPEQLRQVIATRGQFDPSCICVYTEDTSTQEDMVQERIDAQGPVLSDPEWKTEPQGDIAGQGRVDSLIKELSSRTYEFAAKPEAKPKTTNQSPQNNKSVLKPNTTPRGK